jgi:RimK family alpha-L-glutamate ligase
MIFQEFISESSGRDVRINMVGDKAVASMLRYNDNDFRANITNGGSMKKYTPTANEIRVAQTVMKALKLDFGGIDILFGKNEPILCEVNSNAHFKNIYDCTGVNAAEKIFEYILNDIM